jgi:hypothetical protein
MAAGPGPDTFQPHWLVVALQALLLNTTADTLVAVGLDVADSIIAISVDASGARVTLDPDQNPETVLRAPPQVALGLAAGALTVEQAIEAGTLRGDLRDLTAVFAEARRRGPRGE